MNCRNFLQFGILKPARLVKLGEAPEAPSAAPAEVEKPPEASEIKTTLPPAETAKAGIEVRKAGDEEQSRTRREAENLVEQTDDTEKAKQEDAKKTIDELAKKYEAPFEKYKTEVVENPEQAEKTLIDAITDPMDKQRLTDALKIAFPAETEEKKEDSDKTSDALKGVGLGALLERLIDKLTKLFDKLSVELEKAFGSFEKIKSPFGGDKKFTIARGYEAGKGLTIAANANEEIYSASSGTVTKVDSTNKIVEITKDDGSRTVYKNIEPSAGLKTGDDATKIESGKQLVIGKAVSGEGIGFQYFNKNNTEQDPTESFKKAELVEKEPDEPKPTPTAVAAGPTAPATGAPATTPK